MSIPQAAKFKDHGVSKQSQRTLVACLHNGSTEKTLAAQLRQKANKRITNMKSIAAENVISLQCC